jgi:hypothetical protein
VPTNQTIRHRRISRGRSLVLGATLALAGLALTGPAQADTSGSPPPAPQLIAQHPGPRGYYEYDLAVGQVQTATIVVRSPSTSTTVFSLYPADGTTSTATGVIYGGSGARAAQTAAGATRAATRAATKAAATAVNNTANAGGTGVSSSTTRPTKKRNARTTSPAPISTPRNTRSQTTTRR